METALNLGFGYVLIDLPWYMMACIPFKNLRRCSRTVLRLMFVFMTLFRFACGFVLVLCVPDWRNYTWLTYAMTYILLFTFFVCAYRVSLVRLLYVYLLIYTVSTCINQVVLIVLQMLYPDVRMSLSEFPLMSATIFVVVLLLLPVMIPFLRGSLRRAVDTLDVKSLLLLCIVPLVFVFASMILTGYSVPQPSLGPIMLVMYVLLCAMGIISYVVNLTLLLGQSEQMQKEHELETQLMLQAQNYENLTQSIEQTRAARHDLRHHLNVMQSLVARDDKEGMMAYLHEYIESLSVDNSPDWCENRAVNALLRHYLARASQAGASLDIKLDLPMGVGILDTDLCVVFGNVFENAAASAAACGKEGYIRARCATGEQDVVLTVENSIGESAHHGQGIGLKNVELAARKYDGAVRFEARDGIYYSRVLLKKPPVKADAAQAT